MKSIARLLIVLALSSIALMLPAFAAADSNLTVCVSGPPSCDYASIQAAIDTANFGDTIIVGAGMFTEQLKLKSGVTITSTAGPTSTIVTALVSPIISGSQITSVTVQGLGIQGNAALTTPVGLDFYSSTLTLSNIVISDLRGESGMAAHPNGNDAFGVRLTGQSNLTVAHTTIQNVVAGNGQQGTNAMGGHAVGLWADGSGSISVTDSLLRLIVGGKAGTGVNWPYSCWGVGGSVNAIRTNGDIQLVIFNSTIDDLAAGEPCHALSWYCIGNAGAISGIEASGGTLALYDSDLSNFTAWAAWNSSNNYAVHATSVQQVKMERNHITELTILGNVPTQRPDTPDSPYCAPPPGTFIGVASDGAVKFTASGNSLTSIGGLWLSGQAAGFQISHAAQVEITANSIANLTGGSASFTSPRVTAAGVILEQVQSAQIERNNVQHLSGGSLKFLYFGYGGDVVDGGSASAMTLADVNNARIVNNALWDIVGGEGNGVYIGLYRGSNGGDAYALQINNTSSVILNNTLYQTTPGPSLSGAGSPGNSIGLKVMDNSPVLAINNIIAAHGVGISNTSTTAPLIGYNDLWDNHIDYAGTVTGTHDLHADPRFVDASHGDFRLAFSSPLIDHGFTPLSPADDIDGNPRPNDGNGDGKAITDIGAYEFQSTPLHRYYLPIFRGE